MKALFLLLALFATLTIQAQPAGEPVRLWIEDAPGALGEEPKDIPTLTPYLPDEEKGTGAAIVICPGGGYGSLAGHEGEDYALWLRDHGIAAFVLKYRLGSGGYRHPVPSQDAARAIRFVRANADKYKIDVKRVGIMGSSAGGHLASTALTRFDTGKADSDDLIERQSSRPDLGILCYPVITMGDKTHGGSKKNLLGQDPSVELVKELSNELQVTQETPPTFIYHTVEDKVVPVENALMFAGALRENEVPFDLHVYEKGPHGSGLGHKVYAAYRDGNLHPWTANCLFWLKGRGWVK
ncbi:MAG: alpha/beta hydrolase [Verrucomicrobia bacterium]|nr:alpha/beta hydrolase [Verrucomicrobiota bacterium]